MTDAQTVSSGLLRDWPLPSGSGDKDSTGRILIVGGNTGMPGAVLLTAEGAMRAGAGKLQIATVDTVAVGVAIAIPEGYVVPMPADAEGNIAPEAADTIVELGGRCDVVLLGPGFMSPESADALLSRVVPRLTAAVCIDALGLAYLTRDPDGVAHLDGRCVLSPNVDELFTTLGAEPDDDRLLEATAELARRANAVVVSGAEETYIVNPAGVSWSDRSGGKGMAVSGSGDVKAGIIAGLLARGATAEQAAVWGAHVHGRCGERLAARFGRRGYLARDILPEIPLAMTELEQ